MKVCPHCGGSGENPNPIENLRWCLIDGLPGLPPCPFCKWAGQVADDFVLPKGNSPICDCYGLPLMYDHIDNLGFGDDVHWAYCPRCFARTPEYKSESDLDKAIDGARRKLITK